DELGVRYPGRGCEELDEECELARSCLWWWPYRGLCLVCERPAELHIADDGRLHNDPVPLSAFATASRSGRSRAWRWTNRSSSAGRPRRSGRSVASTTPRSGGSVSSATDGVAI